MRCRGQREQEKTSGRPWMGGANPMAARGAKALALNQLRDFRRRVLHPTESPKCRCRWGSGIRELVFLRTDLHQPPLREDGRNSKGRQWAGQVAKAASCKRDWRKRQIT